jgi:hypothetical protein
MSLDKSDNLPDFTSAGDFYETVSTWLNHKGYVFLPPSENLYLADIKAVFSKIRRGPLEIYYHEKIGDYKLGAFTQVFFENVPVLTPAEVVDAKNGPLQEFNLV